MSSKWERQQYILDELKVNRHVTVKALSMRFAISPVTARRDLAELESRGELRRAYRGAVPQNAPPKSFSIPARVLEDENTAIARCAANLAQDGDAIYIGPGKLTMLLARQLNGHTHGMVVTNSIQIVKELNPAERNADVVMIGGILSRDYFITSGPIAEKGLSQLRVRWAFVSAETFDLEKGGGDRFPDEKGVFHSICQISKNVVVLARATELDRAFPTHITPAGAITIIVSDRSAGQTAVDEFQSAGIQLLLAE